MQVARARAEPLTANALTNVFGALQRPKPTDKVHELQKGTLWRPADSTALREPSAAEWRAYRALCAQNVTCFTDEEQRAPINVFEQSDVCVYCGRERFRTEPQKQCCQGGALLLHGDAPAPNYPLPPRLLAMITDADGSGGLSKNSRGANDLFRFAQARASPPCHARRRAALRTRHHPPADGGLLAAREK